MGKFAIAEATGEELEAPEGEFWTIFPEGEMLKVGRLGDGI
jgi:hypothetical protein